MKRYFGFLMVAAMVFVSAAVPLANARTGGGFSGSHGSDWHGGGGGWHGHDAGKALKSKAVSQDWLVEYLRFYIVNAPPSARDDFRRGFISGYGEDGESVYKKAIQDTEHQVPPPPPPARSVTPPSSDAT